VIEVDAMGIMVELASAGVGYTILPGPAVAREIASGAVRSRRHPRAGTELDGLARLCQLAAPERGAEAIFRLMPKRDQFPGASRTVARPPRASPTCPCRRSIKLGVVRADSSPRPRPERPR